jgi:hypothetical protein
MDRRTLSERAASHEHFLDLCRLLDQPTPAQSDRTGADYAFEKPVHPAAAASKGSKGEYGFVDVWKRNHFAWEYKRQGKYKDLRNRVSCTRKRQLGIASAGSF